MGGGYRELRPGEAPIACPKCGRLRMPRGMPNHVAHCEGRKANSKTAWPTMKDYRVRVR